MSRVASTYERREREHYPTPAWVINALAEIVPLKRKTIWEPACGTGEMVEAIKDVGGMPYATDIHDYGYDGTKVHDFLNVNGCPGLVHYDGIITNPPYGRQCSIAEKFVERGLQLISDYGFLALLLPVDFDSAKSRQKFTRDCPSFAGKIVLTKRIKWFEKVSADGKKHGPSENHSWFVWQNTWIGDRHPPRIWYAPRDVPKASKP